MRASLAWAAPARRDFLSALSYLRDRSPQAAVDFHAAVVRQVKRLERFPESGGRVPEEPESRAPLRELLIDDYRLVYAFRDRHIEILALFHARRPFKSTLLR